MYHCPLVRRARLILYKALALSGLALAATLLSAPAAHAGHWVFTCAGSGSNTVSFELGPPNLSNWTPPGSQIGQFSSGKFGNGSDYSTSSSTTVTVTVTATWTPDGGEDDTPPPEVWLCESASAEWMYESSGSADDGFGDAAVSNSDGSLGGTSFTATSNPPPPPYVPAPPPHWKKWPVSGNSVTLPTRTLKAESDFVPTPTRSYGDNCYAFVNGYNVTVHPQPYNFRSGGYTDVNGTQHIAVAQNNPNATLALSYLWSSTDGTRANLGSSTISENLTWDSNPSGVGSFGTDQNGGKVYIPPSPPVGVDAQNHSLAYLDPTVTSQPATNRGITDTFSPESYFSGSPYNNVSWWGDQTYVFSDTGTQETDTPLVGPASGSFRITRTVAPIGNTGQYGYTISTRGSSAGPTVLPGQ